MERGHRGRLRGEGGGWAGEREGRLGGTRLTPDRGRRRETLIGHELPQLCAKIEHAHTSNSLLQILHGDYRHEELLISLR